MIAGFLFGLIVGVVLGVGAVFRIVQSMPDED